MYEESECGGTLPPLTLRPHLSASHFRVIHRAGALCDRNLYQTTLVITRRHVLTTTHSQACPYILNQNVNSQENAS